MTATCEPVIRSKILIESSSAASSGPDNALTWATLGEPFAKIQHKDGDEGHDADQQYATGKTIFTIHASATYANLSAKHRITFAGDVYDILDVVRKPAARTRELVITAKTRRD